MSDTSRTNIARVLREAAAIIASKSGGPKKGFSDLLLSAEMGAIAYSLEALNAQPEEAKP